MFPALYLSHGAPTLALSQGPAADFLRRLPAELPARPSAILVASAHWEADAPTVSSTPRNITIHDFGGFGARLQTMRYDAPGAPVVAAHARDLLREGGFDPLEDAGRGLDHGAWVPLSLAWPDADVPVFQLSVQTHLGPRHHLALGRALAPLRKEGVLIIGSGSWTHDLSSFRGQSEDAPEPQWVLDFADWADAAITDHRVDDLINYRGLAPFAVRNHPTEEHFLPLMVALGAGGGPGRRLHRSTTYGVLHMDAYAFGDAQ
jgi:4,5-DOPA dioxygenase extradiol